ncbi:MAG: hypothetical protein [Bacteriophage sp.]|nr:MAG: hypothetical protein [Bacteriophage sp.]
MTKLADNNKIIIDAIEESEELSNEIQNALDLFNKNESVFLNLEKSILDIKANANKKLEELSEDNPSRKNYEIMIKNCDNILTQENLLDFIKNSNINKAVAILPNLLETKAKSLKNIKRTYNISNLDLKVAIKNSKKYGNNAVVRKKTALVYAFTLFVNHLKEIGKLQENVLYIALSATTMNLLFTTMGSNKLVEQAYSIMK